ncbi:MAG: Gfo/Idh/MocA family oxidoreductase [Bacteroidota bacterium]
MQPSKPSPEEESSPVETQDTYRYRGKPLRVGVVGLVHTHVHWVLGREKWGDIEIVGIAEPNRELAAQYSAQHGYSMDLVYEDLSSMLAATQPEAVLAFNTIYDHLSVVEICAPKGIHVMVEKPLAVSYAHAQQMAALAREHGIQLLTNYETSWYGSNQKAYEVAVEKEMLGDLRRLIFHTGHPGPIEIGCNQEFLEWLTDPVLNGGGALTDFGCYGANLATWFMAGKTPHTVTALTQQIKPDLYPKVEDEATILLAYDEAQVIIQASWNWSHNRKDMEVYGKHGYLICKNGEDMVIMEGEKNGPSDSKAAPLPMGIHDPFAYLNQVVKQEVTPAPFSVSSLENNLIVMQILEAAKYSAAKGERVRWDDFF